MICEIRNYHFNPTLFEAYKIWAKTEAIPYLARSLDVIGFWLNTNDEPEVHGEPQDALGSANSTWIIRWNDVEHRQKVLPGVLSGPEWESIFSRVPGGGKSYLRTESRFAEQI